MAKHFLMVFSHHERRETFQLSYQLRWSNILAIFNKNMQMVWTSFHRYNLDSKLIQFSSYIGFHKLIDSVVPHNFSSIRWSYLYVIIEFSNTMAIATYFKSHFISKESVVAFQKVYLEPDSYHYICYVQWAKIQLIVHNHFKNKNIRSPASNSLSH